MKTASMAALFLMATVILSTSIGAIARSKCDYKCDGRCWKQGRRKGLCFRYCLLCCERCNYCVPIDLAGLNMDQCPCYRDLKSPKGLNICP
ncbi:hypothetical protein Leryth_022265 [Lithospermum erythrorhizon]|uniref:Gibberellin regulated protein n=1 Tax=Lithospermum erythrorhizon TaxID=34254 RepID=A0AAV3QXH3_LITER|nr:hypothetical protein Leryth_022265 [Lithospermum erythrorhizon]